jgi:hypothetical protein
MKFPSVNVIRKEFGRASLIHAEKKSRNGVLMCYSAVEIH